MKISKVLTSALLVGALTVVSVFPAFAGTLEQDKAWVEAQAAGLKKAKAYLEKYNPALLKQLMP